MSIVTNLSDLASAVVCDQDGPVAQALCVITGMSQKEFRGALLPGTDETMLGNAMSLLSTVSIETLTTQIELYQPPA